MSYFRSIKGAHRPDLFKFHSINGGVTGPCGSNAVNPGTRYNYLVEETGGLRESICTTDWTDTLRNIASSTFDLQPCFTLSSAPGPGPGDDPANPDTWFDVILDGESFPATELETGRRWRFDEAANALCFEPFWIPPSGQRLEVAYDVACLP